MAVAISAVDHGGVAMTRERLMETRGRVPDVLMGLFVLGALVKLVSR